MQVLNNKSDQRRYLKKLRGSIPCGLRKKKSADISRRLLNSDEYRSANTIMIYMSFGTEVETDTVFDTILRDKKRLVVPLCNTENRTMKGCYIPGKSCLETGNYGIYEPKRTLVLSGEICTADKRDIDLIIVPGLGFDKDGYRIGYGMGYYDRYLDGFDGRTVGLCFKECMLEHIFSDEFDKKIDRIITD